MTSAYVSYYGQADDTAPGSYDPNDIMNLGVYVPAGGYYANGYGYGYGSYTYDAVGNSGYGYYDGAAPDAPLYVPFAGYGYGYGYGAYAAGGYYGSYGYGEGYGYGAAYGSSYID